MAVGFAEGLDDVEVRMLVQGVIGKPVATEFLAWVEDADLVDPAIALDDPLGVELPRRQDQLHAAATSVAALALARDTPEDRSAAWQFLARLASNGGAATATVAARQLAQRHPMGEPVPTEAAGFIEVLRAAGLV